jgi:hypothetical protein
MVRIFEHMLEKTQYRVSEAARALIESAMHNVCVISEAIVHAAEATERKSGVV